MKHFLIVVDMQNDFVDGSLGSAEAQVIVPEVVKKINAFEGTILATLDTHPENYLETAEGKKLPVAHCVEDTDGWEINDDVLEALENKGYTRVRKETFGSIDLPYIIERIAGSEDFSVELIGLCTDICVVSNALLLKAHFPEKEITVDSGCCAGVSTDTHDAALKVMSCCQINIK